MKICMIGAGYVGLVSAACFADFGWNVTCVDKDEDRVARLKKGEIPIYEPGLDELVARNVAAGRMHFLSSLREGVQGADVVFLAVGTPIRRGDGYADLSLCVRGRRRAGAAYRALHRHHHQIDRAGRHQPGDRAPPQGAASRRRVRGVLKSGILARRLGHPRLHASRPRAGRLRQRARARGVGEALRAACSAQGAARLRQPRSRPSLPNTRPMHFSP